MTAVGLGPVPRNGPLADGERAEALAWLARQFDYPAADRAQLLAAWAHPSLTAKRAGELFAAWQADRVTAEALRSGDMKWQQWDPTLTTNGRDPQDVAIDWSAEEADVALALLLHGEGKQ